MARRSQRVERTAAPAVKASPPAQSNGPFTLEEVKALVQVLEGTDVTSLRWDRNGQQLVIRRGHAAPAPAQAAFGGRETFQHAQVLAPLVPAGQGAPAAPAPAAVAAKAEPAPGLVVTSPFVGTFYRAPSPESAAFVEVGTVVKKGQVLCIVEAMKLMNELEAEAPGKISEILVANASPVEFGQPLFRIEPV